MKIKRAKQKPLSPQEQQKLDSHLKAWKNLMAGVPLLKFASQISPEQKEEASIAENRKVQLDVQYFQAKVERIKEGKSFNSYEISYRSSGVIAEILVPKQVTLSPSGCLDCVVDDREITWDEVMAYRWGTLYVIGKSYLFTVVDVTRVKNTYCAVLLDRFNREQEVETEFPISKGDKLVCEVENYRTRRGHKRSLVLVNPRFKVSEHVEDKHRASYGAVSQMRLKCNGMSYHRVHEDHKCSCCGRIFSPSQGVKMEMREEIYLCNSCKDDVLDRSNKATRRNYSIIYTPWGISGSHGIAIFIVVTLFGTIGM